MKKIFLSVLVPAMILAGCRENTLGPEEARITGKIMPVVPGYLNVTAGSFLDSTKIEKDGTFSITLPLTEPGKAMIFFANRLADLYLEPGKELELTFNPFQFPEGLEFSGQSGPVNHYLSLARKLDQQTAIPLSELFSKEPIQFQQFSDSIRNLKIRLIEEYQSKYREIDPGFAALIHTEIDFAWADQHLLYPGQYFLLKGTEAQLPPDYHTGFLTRLNLQDPLNLQSSAFKTFIQNFLDYRQQIYLADNPKTASLIFPKSVARFRVIHEEFSEQKIVDYLLYTAISDHLANFGTTKIESFLNDFRISCKNDTYLNEIETVAANLGKVGLGQPAIDFTAYTPDGKKVRISDYFGELLYIGFWASWSEWSLNEIPYFEQLRRDFSGKPVKFLLISLDFEKDKNRWAAIIDKNSFGSIQLIQDPKSTILRDSYYLNDFPRYFLIGKDGKIISAFAPRPTENIAETLNRLLQIDN